MIIIDGQAHEIAPVQQVAVSQSISSSAKPRTRSYGVCVLAPMRDNTDYAASVSALGYPVSNQLIKDFAPAGIVEALKWGVQTQEMMDWERGLKATVLVQPKHGSDVMGKGSYLPDHNYLGKDKVVTLVEGKDKNGNDFSVVVKFYVNVVTEKTRMDFGSHFKQFLQKYCGSNDVIWRISSESVSQYSGANIAAAWPNYDHSNFTVNFSDIPGQSE